MIMISSHDSQVLIARTDFLSSSFWFEMDYEICSTLNIVFRNRYESKSKSRREKNATLVFKKTFDRYTCCLYNLLIVELLPLSDSQHIFNMMAQKISHGRTLISSRRFSRYW